MADAPTVLTVAPWKAGAAPMAWVGGRVYYNKRASRTAPFEGWSSKPDGTGARRVTTAAVYPAGTQKGVGDVTPDGRYALVTVERSGHWPIPDGAYIAAPGAGTYNDLWLQTTDGRKAWKLRDLVAVKANALIWPRFDPTGTRVVWSEQWRFGLPFGKWRFFVAKLVWKGGVPSLKITASRRTEGFVEPYGILPDGRVLFVADKLAGTGPFNLQLMSLPASLKGDPVRLSPRDRPTTSDWSNYNEFAYQMPGRDRLLYARSVGAWFHSLEYWTSNLDGSDPVQLTGMSIPWSPHYQGHPSIVGGLAFDPDDPNRFVAGIATDLEGNYKSVMVTLK
jgi:hypothetical protein